MRVRICCLLIATLTLSACGGWRDSNVNPRNWFGGGGGSVPNTQAQLAPLTPSDRQTGNPLIDDDDSAQIVRANTTPVARSGGLFRRTRQAVYAGTLVDQISDIGVESLPTGRILKVTGAPLREGAFDVRLIEVNPDGPVNGVLEYTLNALQPADFGRGTETTRRVEAAAFISNADLEGVRQIRVRAQRNAQTITP